MRLLLDQMTAPAFRGGLFFGFFPLAVACFLIAFIQRPKGKQFQVHAKTKHAPIFGSLSVSAPFVSGLLFYTSMNFNVGGDIFVVVGLSALGGFASAIIAWKRHEPYRALWLIGLLLNSAPLVMVGSLLLSAGSHC